MLILNIYYTFQASQNFLLLLPLYKIIHDWFFTDLAVKNGVKNEFD